MIKIFKSGTAKKSPKSYGGDTIVEVLIAIAVAAFVIGTSYAIANHSLQTAINARDRGQALNLIEGQIAALKFRYKTDKANFPKNFEVPAGFVGPGIAFHFCMDTTWLGPYDPNTAKEGPQSNTTLNEANANNLALSDPDYNAICKPTVDGTTYYLDIAAMETAASRVLTGSPTTVYKIEARWAGVGVSQTQQATIYYRF